ncbi:MAG TPA: multidrug effflux MFS transporter [Alphaproteobacteria bacterium]|nr:multidrug effflux MFS transporter [Alphaproteobacteria bacterium]
MPQRSNLFIICILGALSIISPFAIDMCLPAYLQMAKDFGVQSTTISLTLSSYFIGLASGQVVYGPLLDRFGRKIPLCVGLVIFILASIGCAMAPDVSTLIVFRFIQALGGCAAQVASLAMVRDFFPVNQSAKILSRLFLFISVSPLLAPTIGGAIMAWVSWRAVFGIMMVIVALILLLVWRLLPEAHKPDKTISLKPGPIFLEYLAIIKNARFATYALAGAFSFAGLFTYVAGSPIIFMEGFHLSAKTYSMIFALLASGFIGASQINVLLLKKFTSAQLFYGFLILQVIAALIFVTGVWANWYGLTATLVLFFISLSCAGITYPNAAAMAMAPFTKNAGSAAALLGFLQLGVGAVISSGISASTSHGSLPIIAILAVTSCLGLIVLMIGQKKAASKACAHE